MVIQFDSTFERAETILQRSLVENNISFGVFNSRLVNMCSVKHYEICNVGRNAEDDANLTLNLTYTIAEADDTGILRTFDKTRTLNLLTTAGDIYWTHNMIAKVWDGEYPSTVGYDIASGEVFLVYIRSWGIDLKYFATLSPEALESFDNLNLSRPYKIYIKPDAMFKFIDGCEGTNHLKENLYISFDCMHPIDLDVEVTLERIY